MRRDEWEWKYFINSKQEIIDLLKKWINEIKENNVTSFETSMGLWFSWILEDYEGWTLTYINPNSIGNKESYNLDYYPKVSIEDGIDFLMLDNIKSFSNYLLNNWIQVTLSNIPNLDNLWYITFCPSFESIDNLESKIKYIEGLTEEEFYKEYDFINEEDYDNIFNKKN